MISTVEYIHHYTCDQCKGWWSIASHENYKPKAMYCPHCGYKHSVINNVDIKDGTPKQLGR